MGIIETTAKSLLSKHKRIDGWFVCRYGMNLYRGCTHDCAYCDGRAEGYYVKGAFGQDVEVKINAPDLLQRELNPTRRRKPLKPGYVMIGGGVGDAYQPANETYQLARRVLAVLETYGFPVHILTKSCQVQRDLDIIARINDKQRAIVSMSLSSVDDAVARVFEPECSLPRDRLDTLSKFKRAGISTGVFLMPVIPFVSDTSEAIEASVRAALEAGVDFVIFGGMTLKTGRQRDHFTRVLDNFRPGLASAYARLYTENRWGTPNQNYHTAIYRTFARIADELGIAHRMPPRLYADIVDDTDRVVVMLDHLAYFHQLAGQPSPYGRAASAIAKHPHPISLIRSDLRATYGIGQEVEKIIQEILSTGSCCRLNTFFPKDQRAQ
ncbi:MAG: radical SAM protein [Myxococcota bacterium]|nr:radical SAM protein [Myxococcota bacterium]